MRRFRLECRVAEHRLVVVGLGDDRLDVPLASLAIAQHVGVEAAVGLRERLVRREPAAALRPATADHRDLLVRLLEIVHREEAGDPRLGPVTRAGDEADRVTVVQVAEGERHAREAIRAAVADELRVADRRFRPATCRSRSWRGVIERATTAPKPPARRPALSDRPRRPCRVTRSRAKYRFQHGLQHHNQGVSR